MDHSIAIQSWKDLIAKLDADHSVVNDAANLEELIKLFKHLKPQTAIRHQIDIESCTSRTNQLIPELFNDLDCSNRELFSTFLHMVLSYGYFRLAQITYHNAPQMLEASHLLDSLYLPIITKLKWYELAPLLPDAGEMGWKGVLNSGLVREETLLLPICFKLLTQKLHFYCIIMNLQQFQPYKEVCIKNGKKVAEKLLEIIRDVAFNEEIYFIGINAQLFNLIIPFLEEPQIANFLEAIVEDLFKPYISFKQIDVKHAAEIAKLQELIRTIIMKNTKYQDIMVTCLISHLKTNMIRRKRRHSTESSTSDGLDCLVGLLSEMIQFPKSKESLDAHVLLEKSESIEISTKNIQSNYLNLWSISTKTIISKSKLTTNNLIRLIGVTTVILNTAICGSNDSDITKNLCLLIVKILESMKRSSYEKVLNYYGAKFMIELTNSLERNSELLIFDSPIQQVYSSYLKQYFAWVIQNGGKNIQALSPFVEFICDKTLNKKSSRLLQYIVIQELANFVYKNKSKQNIQPVCRDWAKLCGKGLYKFIKHRSNIKTLQNGIGSNQSENESMMDVSSSEEQDATNGIAVDALVSLSIISIRLEDQVILDLYSDILYKLFANVGERVNRLVHAVKSGHSEPVQPLDRHLATILMLYIDHKEAVKNYMDYDLIDELLSIFMLKDDVSVSKASDADSEEGKNTLSRQIIDKLDTIQKSANKKNANVYQTIINQQYSSATEGTVASIGDHVSREKVCCHDYLEHITILYDLADLILTNCDIKKYKLLLENVVETLDSIDPYNHPLVLYTFLLLRSINSPKNPSRTKQVTELFQQQMPKISCNLMRISKFVELGPSIHVFTNPGSHQSNRSAQCCTYSNCINLYTQIFMAYPKRITKSILTDALEMVISSNLGLYAKNHLKFGRFFIQLGFAIVRLLKSIHIGSKDDEVVTSTMPIFLSILNHTMRCIIIASDITSRDQSTNQMNGFDKDVEDTKPSHEELFENQLELLAIEIGRTLNNLSYLRVRLIDYAPHLISAYIKDCQRCACADHVKSRLDEGIFRIFNLVDAHQKERQDDVVQKGVQRKMIAGKATGSLFDMIHARLDQASREVFRDLHDDYSRFHRYLGKC